MSNGQICYIIFRNKGNNIPNKFRDIFVLQLEFESFLMSRRILTFMCLTAVVLGLTACSQNSHTNNKDNGRVSSTQKQAPKKLVAQDLSDSEKASAITVYGALKYKKAWQKTYQAADKNGLSVAVKSATAFRYIKDKGYIYQVSGNGKEPDTFYILEGSTVNFYNRKK